MPTRTSEVTTSMAKKRAESEQIFLDVVRIANSDLRHGLEFDCNQEASLPRCETPHRLQLKLHLAMIASNVSPLWSIMVIQDHGLAASIKEQSAAFSSIYVIINSQLNAPVHWANGKVTLAHRCTTQYVLT